MSKSFFLSFVFLVALLTLSVFSLRAVLAASSVPSFPSCSSPTGNVLASYNDGIHGIVGDYRTYTGSDSVYDQGRGNALQCFCGESGIQTNWWNISPEEMSSSDIKAYEDQGWVYVLDGSLWGLENAPYLAINSSYDCSNPTPTPTPDPDVCHNIDGIQTAVPDGQHLDASGLNCVNWSQSGPAPRNDENGGSSNSGQVLGASTSPKGQVLGASTMAKTGSFAELSNMIIMTLGGTLSAFGIKKASKKAK